MIVLEKDMSMKFSASSKHFCFSSFPLYFGMLVFWFVLSFSLSSCQGGQFTETQVADKAYDYDGLWLFWWDQENQTEMYETYQSMGANQGTIVLGGGAAILQTEAKNGAYALAFSEDYEKKQDVVDAFEALENE